MMLRKIHICIQKNKARPLSYTTHTIMNSKWIKDLNVRPETIKLPGENIGKKLLDIGLSSYYLDTIPKAQTIKAKINKCTSN